MDFLKKLLSFLGTPYQLGAHESPIDLRNISLSSFQKPVQLPNEYETEMTAVRNQGSRPKCVPSAMAEVKELYLKRKGFDVFLSDDDLYDECKKKDGIPNISGTYPSVCANIICSQGVATVQAYESRDQDVIEKSRNMYKLGGYAFVSHDFDSICQAIYQNGAIVASFLISKDWFKGLIVKVLKAIGRHMVVLNGFRYYADVVYGQNSWGVEWIGRITGLFNSAIKPGHFELLWSQYEENVSDCIVFTDVPEELLQEAKKEKYYFTSTLRMGSTGPEVVKLQEFLNLKPDGSFGPATQQEVMKYQRQQDLPVDGVVGPKTRERINGKVSKLDLWCEAIKKMEGAKPSRNNPGNIRYLGQKYAVDDNGFCKFDTYEHGYEALRNLLTRAATGKSAVYKSDMNLYEFYGKYAPDSDGNDSKNYAKFVAKFIGVSPETKIKELL